MKKEKMNKINCSLLLILWFLIILSFASISNREKYLIDAENIQKYIEEKI